MLTKTRQRSVRSWQGKKWKPMQTAVSRAPGRGSGADPGRPHAHRLIQPPQALVSGVVSHCYCNKLSLTQWLKTTHAILRFWRSEVHSGSHYMKNQSVTGCVSSGGSGEGGRRTYFLAFSSVKSPPAVFGSCFFFFFIVQLYFINKCIIICLSQWFPNFFFVFYAFF